MVQYHWNLQVSLVGNRRPRIALFVPSRLSNACRNKVIAHAPFCFFFSCAYVYQALVRWVCDEGPRGLEVYSSRLHALRRQRHLQESKHAVLGEQARQRHGVFLDASSYQQNGVGQGGGGGGDEVLAWRAAQASQRARTFATLLGQADAWVAHRHLHDDDNDADEYGSSSDDSPPSTGAVDEPPEVTEESSPSSCDA